MKRDFFGIVLRFVLTLTIKSWATTKHWNQINSGWFFERIYWKDGWKFTAYAMSNVVFEAIFNIPYSLEISEDIKK